MENNDYGLSLYDIAKKLNCYPYLLTHPFGQDMTQGQFLSRV